VCRVDGIGVTKIPASRQRISEKQKKTMTRTTIISHSKTLFIYTLILATAAGFLAFHMEHTAREMERETYTKQINELTAKVTTPIPKE
jgi:hypothetical protein